MKSLKKIIDNFENNKIIRIIYKILKTICTIILLMILVVTLVQKFSDNSLAIKGYRIFSVATLSMADEYSVGDIIIVKETPAADLKVGDNVTYLGAKSNLNGFVITHKIMSIRKDENDYYYVTKGTANEVEDPEISYSQIYGKVIYKTVLFSYIGRVMTNVYSYYALFTIVGLIVFYQIVKIRLGGEDEEEETKDNS